MAYRTCIFIDFWNFSLRWTKRANGSRVHWTELPTVLLKEGERELRKVGLDERLLLQETRVYGSYDATEGGKRLENWLKRILSKEPGYQVRAKPRQSTPTRLHCRRCSHIVDKCPHCHSPYHRANEKGIDTAIVKDLIAFASEDSFDVVILVSVDADFVPAVEWLQDRGFPVVNATWAAWGFTLQSACWASIELDYLLPDLTRPPKVDADEVAKSPLT